MSNRTFVRLMLSIPFMACLLITGWAHAADSCTSHEVLVTAKDGSQHISVHTVCVRGAK